ncbi:MAG TPA: hypothetical protein VGQ48_11600 [Gemmatimonadales bacterium]|jgi:hypothetical protein|nr:hypothetical protein [Gemmatimonadales bacterium]
MKTLVLGAVAAALLHITPTVVLVKRQDAVARLLPGADRFAARELHLSSADSRRLHDAVGWEPPDGVVTFYIGRRQDQVSGVLVFMRVDCQHGPIELAIGYDPRGAIRGVEVTKATVEMKPWIVEALRAGLTEEYRGLAVGQSPSGAQKVKGHIGAMPEYMAELIDKGVMHANAAYRLFYRSGAQIPPGM